MSFSLIILAGGNSHRFRSNIGKPYQKIAGKSLIEINVMKALKFKQIKKIVLVYNKKDIKLVKSLKLKKVVLINGCKTRQQSTFNALKYLIKKGGTKKVLVHDVARPNFSIKLLNYKESTGDSLYRRSMYTFIRRTNPPPSMSTFDAPTREVCTVKREITNTPLQALVLLNDPQFVEASRILAERIQKEKPSSIDESIKHGFRLCTSRKPRDKEIELLRKLYDEQLIKFKQNPKLAYNIFKNGKKPRDKTLNLYKTAALSMVANVMLNHDEKKLLQDVKGIKQLYLHQHY